MRDLSGLAALLGAVFFVSLSPDVSGQQPPVAILAPTFSQHVAPIVYAKCIQCHRPGAVAPMSLINYRDVQPWTTSIRKQLVERTMPPFHNHSRYGLLGHHAAADAAGNQHDCAVGGHGRAGRRPRAPARAARTCLERMPYAARILVATDFSPLSTLALDHAMASASLCRASIDLLHVESDAKHDGDGEEARLASLASRCQSEAIVVTSQICAGQPAAVIVQAAAERAVDLIVLGTHGRHGLAHLMLGSVAEAVVRTATCPVLTVRGHVPERAQLPVEAAFGLLPTLR